MQLSQWSVIMSFDLTMICNITITFTITLILIWKTFWKIFLPNMIFFISPLVWNMVGLPLSLFYLYKIKICFLKSSCDCLSLLSAQCTGCHLDTVSLCVWPWGKQSRWDSGIWREDTQLSQLSLWRRQLSFVTYWSFSPSHNAPARSDPWCAGWTHCF